MGKGLGLASFSKAFIQKSRPISKISPKTAPLDLTLSNSNVLVIEVKREDQP